MTISYRWYALDYERGEVRPLSKPIGGFFVGCSVEGLMALGTVRAHIAAKAPKVAEINGAEYEMSLFRSGNGRHIRTFYPKFRGGIPRREEVQEQPGFALRIVAALINPEGHDPGAETVTLLNTAPAATSLKGLRLADRNGRQTPLPEVDLEAGATLRVALGELGAQLSNRGGDVLLQAASGEVLHSVSYSKAQAKRQGYSVIF